MYQYKAMQAIAEKFKEDHWPIRTSASDGREYLYVQSIAFKVHFLAEFICTGDNKCIALRINSLISGLSDDDEQTLAALVCCNLLNKRWKMFKFYLNGDSISVHYDFPPNCGANIADLAYNAFITLVVIVNKIYPDLRDALSEEE